MIIFVSVPVIDGNHEEAAKRMRAAGDKLVADGHQPAFPNVLRLNSVPEDPEAIAQDVRNTIAADGTLFLKGWKADDRCQIAHFTAKRLNKFIIYE